jgi:hypothetical protein
MRLVPAKLLAVFMLLLLTVPACAQFRDYDCADFSSQAESQQAYDQYPGDPSNLDTDGDGVACESTPEPPSPKQSSAYLSVAVLLISAAAGLSLVSQRRRARSVEDKELQERLAELQSNLRSMATSLEEIDERVSARRTAVDQLQRDARRAEELSKLSARQVDALDHRLTGRDRRSLRLNIAIQVVLTIVGIGSSILISMYL